MAEKRRGSPSCSLSISKTQKRAKQVWGRHKNDLQPVKITIIEPNDGAFSIFNFSEVNYTTFPTEHGSTENINAIIKPYDGCNLAAHVTILTPDYESKLQPLKAQLGELATLIESETLSWDLSERTNFPKTGLCRKVMNGFLHNMSDTAGKEAVRVLFSEIITMLQLDESLHVIQTGSPRHSTYLSTLVQIDKQTKRSSGDNYATEDSLPDYRVSASHDDKIATPDSLGCQLKEKLSTTDVLVYSQNEVDKPIQAKIVISLKKGNEKSIRDLVIDLLSRLPYQSGHIFGLRINASEAIMCSVKLADPDYTGQSKVNIFCYQPHIFRHFDQPFNLDSFFNFILDIGRILASANPNT